MPAQRAASIDSCVDVVRRNQKFGSGSRRVARRPASGSPSLLALDGGWRQDGGVAREENG
jgi:hypothetical protein